MCCSCYSKLHQEELHEKYTELGVVGVTTFPFAFASHLHEPVGIISQRIEKINVSIIWFNWYVRPLFSFSLFVKFYLRLSFFIILSFDFLLFIFFIRLLARSFIY